MKRISASDDVQYAVQQFAELQAEVQHEADAKPAADEHEDLIEVEFHGVLLFRRRE